MVLDSIGYSATAPSTGATAAAVTGDSLTIRFADAGKRIELVGLIAKNQTAGYHQVTGPTFSDTTRGLRVRVPASEAREWLGLRRGHPVKPSDVLAVTIAGSATAGDLEEGVLLVWYEELPGISGRFLSVEDLRANTVRLVSVYATLTAGTAGGWSGAEVITSESDLLRANTDYAVLGAVSSVECTAIGLRSPDWGNLRIAVPGHDLDAREGSDFLVRQAERLGLPTVPVFNSGNKNNVWLDCLQDENGSAPVVSVILAEVKL